MAKNPNKRIVLTGGGTGGHLYPLAAVAQYIRANTTAEIEFLFLGPNGPMEQKVMDEYQIPRKKVASGKLRRYFSLSYFLDIFLLPWGFLQALGRLLFFMPDVVFSKGGFASVPVVLAARFYRIPVLVHESDAVPGLANRILGSLATRIAINFERAAMHFPASKVIKTGVPVRQEVLQGNEEAGRTLLGMKKQVKPVVLILGGSQGAQAINNEILFNLEELLKNYQLVHQTGTAHYHFVVEVAEKKGYKIGYSDYYPLASYQGGEAGNLLALADVVVSRCGATAISEIAAHRKPAILVPIKESANDHQRINAFEVAKKGGAVVLEEGNFRKGLIFYNLEKLTQNEKVRENLGELVSQFYYPTATENIARVLFEIMK